MFIKYLIVKMILSFNKVFVNILKFVFFIQIWQNTQISEKFKNFKYQILFSQKRSTHFNDLFNFQKALVVAVESNQSHRRKRNQKKKRNQRNPIRVKRQKQRRRRVEKKLLAKAVEKTRIRRRLASHRPIR